MASFNPLPPPFDQIEALTTTDEGLIRALDCDGKLVSLVSLRIAHWILEVRKIEAMLTYSELAQVRIPKSDGAGFLEHEHTGHGQGVPESPPAYQNTLGMGHMEYASREGGFGSPEDESSGEKRPKRK